MTTRARRSLIDERSSYCPPTSLTDLVKVYRKSEVGDEIEILVDPASKTDPTARRDIETWAKKTGNVVQPRGEKKFVRLVMTVSKKPRNRRSAK